MVQYKESIQFDNVVDHDDGDDGGSEVVAMIMMMIMMMIVMLVMIQNRMVMMVVHMHTNTNSRLFRRNFPTTRHFDDFA